MTARSINHVALTVRDLPGMASFYEAALGLELLGSDQSTRRLGAAGQVLLELRHEPGAGRLDPCHAGLFHTAFLLPERADLGRWRRHAAANRVQLTGASDHGVSEALYLNDPEGNGIEIYWDRAPSEWVRDGDRIEMFTHRLDLPALSDASPGQWQGAPQGTTIGHVHLQVGDLGQADGFFQGELDLTRTFDGPGGAWYGWNGYHHQLAGNIWNSRGAGPRDLHMTGLAEVVISDPDRAGQVLTDPWGTPFRFV